MSNPSDYIPKATNWFVKTLVYKGKGRIEFSNPKGWIEGEITCEVSQTGEMDILLEIENWENYEAPNDPSSLDSRDWLVAGMQLQQLNSAMRIYAPISPRNTVISLVLQNSDGGVFTSDRINVYYWQPVENTITLYVDMATYIAPNKSKTATKYWVLPCINFDPQSSFGYTEAQRYHELYQHPLRIFPVPDGTKEFLTSDASNEEKTWVNHNLIAMSYVICFFYNQEPAFIERLPNYEQITKDLKEGVTRLGVTSVMVGTYASEEDETKPIDLLPVLGLATGRPVGASWIEFRDQKADLVYRFHANLGRYTYGRGRSIVNDIIHKGGIGKLLTEVTKSNKTSDPLIRGALRNCALAVSGEDTTIIFYYAFTALESLFKFYDIDQAIHPLKTFLSSLQIAAIELILTQARNDILNLQNTVPTPYIKQFETINKVANNARGQPLETRIQFGDELVELVYKCGFSDIDVLSGYYTIDEWKQKVTKYRGATMHSTHFENIFDPQVKQDFRHLLPHILDILIRVLLKTIGYTDNYSPYMKPGHDDKVDWVKPTTSPSSLGYK